MFFLFLSLLQVDDSVFCAGQIALVPCTMQLVKAGTRTQAHLSFGYVKKVLEAVINRLTLAHVVQAHCYTTRQQDIPIIRAVWENMLKAAEEEKVSHCGVRLLFMKQMLLVKEKSYVRLFYYRFRRNIDHTRNKILHPHRMNTFLMD